jgi:hypothetical protein
MVFSVITEEAMVPEFVSVAHFYAVSANSLERLVGDFSPEDWTARDAAGHTPRWIMGHVAWARLRLAEMMGHPPIPVPWMAAFARGAFDVDVPEDLDMGSVVQAFHDAHQAMTSRWEVLTDEDFAKPLGRTLPDGADTIGGGIRFLAWHEAYHMGQLGLLRRVAGKPGFA